jgi:hypothetical protein
MGPGDPARQRASWAISSHSEPSTPQLAATSSSCNIGFVEQQRWLLLGHQLPTRSSNARVKTWRRLQQIGAVPARNSVYVLPNTEQCREDFEWIRSEIVALGGEATVFAADAISAGGTEDIVAVFQRTREEDFRLLKRDIDRLLPSGKGQRARSAAKGRMKGRTARVLRERFMALERIDFFPTAVRAETTASLLALEEAMQEPAPQPSEQKPHLDHAHFQSRRWVTRPRPGVDRMATAWLIRRFVDKDATFAFAEAPSGPDVPFDMYAGEFSHHGALCTFEVMVDRFRLKNPAVAKVGQIVHDLDMKDTKYDPPEAVAVGRMVDGLRALHADDVTLLEHGIGMFDALASSFESDQGASRRTKVPKALGATKSTRRDAARTRPKQKGR